MRLTAYTRNQLEDASRDAVTDAMDMLPLDAVPPRWMLQGQKYSRASISRDLRNDYVSGSIDDSALAQRIAASIPSHVIDGWSYLGRAVHCFVRGDTRNAVHLAYYGELRATLAIMAAEGIGIFDNQHFIIDKNGATQRIGNSPTQPTRSGTHSIIWPIYRWWAQQDISRDLVALVIKPGGSPITNWFSSVNNRNLLSSAGRWLDDWGLDLKRMDTDKEARNASSYGPSAIHDWQILSGGEAIDEVKRLWRLFEPALFSRFNEIDRLLLRRVLRTLFAAQTWNSDFNTFVEDFLDDQTDPSIVGSQYRYWQQFLCDESTQNGLILESASRKSPVDSAVFPIEILSRTALLLRIATGACGRHLDEIGIGWESLEFWLDALGVRRGFWGLDTYPEYPTDLWADINDALELLDEAQEPTNSQDNSPHVNKTDSFVSSLTRLEECERIGFWGFGI